MRTAGLMIALLLTASPALATPDDVVPTAKSQAEFAFPPQATKKAYLKIAIDKKGAVNSCEVLRSSGDAAWDNKMCNIMAFNKTFEPMRKANGRPRIGTKIVPVWQ